MPNIRITILPVMFFFLTLFTACNMDDDRKSWTIMVYLDADNDLEMNGVFDINEMEYGLFRAITGDPSVLNDLNIIVQFDRRTVNSGRPDLGWNSTRRYLVMPDANSDEYGRLVSLPIADLGEVNMGDAASLADFIGFCKSSFPARHYMLVLWNHGGGVRSAADEYPRPAGVKNICLDWQNSATYPAAVEQLYTAEITDVLTAAESVDVIGIDACVSGMAEIAYEFRPGADKFGASYMVASPPNEAGDGWEYHKILERFKGHGTDREGDPCFRADEISPETLASIVVKEYEDGVLDEDSPVFLFDQAFGAYDLGKIGAVKLALDALAVSLPAEQPDIVNDIQMDGSSARTMHYFHDIDDISWIHVPHFDLYDFAARINADSDRFSSDIRTLAGALMTAVDDCVIASWGLEEMYPAFLRGKNGLGFFFPGNDVYEGAHYYWYEWWYTAEDTATWWGNDPERPVDPYYGKLDFCEQGPTVGVVENWRELLESWYDPTNAYTPGTW